MLSVKTSQVQLLRRKMHQEYPLKKSQVLDNETPPASSESIIHPVSDSHDEASIDSPANDESSQTCWRR